MSLCADLIGKAEQRRGWLIAPLVLALSACGLFPIRPPEEVKPSNVNADVTLTPATRVTRDLVKLPPPQFKVPVAVYAFRDQTGQFRAQPESNLSNAVTQGAAAILVKALLDSGWYLPVEREGFQNLLNERRVARAIEVPADKGKPGTSYPQLVPAQFVMEGGIVGFETNVRTGGSGANLLGIGAEAKYRVDQVTVNLRSIDVRTGQVVNSVSVTKTIFSNEVSSSVYKFVAYQTLLQAEAGYSTNEPGQLAVKEAVESAVIHLTAQGIAGRVWALKNEQDWYSPVLQRYMRESELQLAAPESTASAPEATVPMREASLIKPAQLPLYVMPPPQAPDNGAAHVSINTPPAPHLPATTPPANLALPSQAPTPVATAPEPTPAAVPAVEQKPTKNTVASADAEDALPSRRVVAATPASSPLPITAPHFAPQESTLAEPQDGALLTPAFVDDTEDSAG